MPQLYLLGLPQPVGGEGRSRINLDAVLFLSIGELPLLGLAADRTEAVFRYDFQGCLQECSAGSGKQLNLNG